MPEDHLHDEALAMEALLYASDELEGDQRQAFEQRLSSDQAAREALCQAVQMSQALTGQQPAVPNRAYRVQVRQRLGGRRPGRYRGHPLLWLATGAAAAVLVMLGLGQPEPPAPIQPPVVVQAAPPAPEDPPEAEVNDPMLEVATYWAELSNSERLARDRTEEARRKLRLEDRTRPASAGTMKN
jgi:anti-sigma factor RsiW